MTMNGSMNLQLSLIGSARPGSHVFGPEGGAFGRSQKCDWVLPDEERILSSVHGRLVFSNGQFMLVDESTNGIFVNGLPEPLGRGNSIVLSDGTRFSAGRYTIEARLVAAERPQAPMRQGAGYAPRSSPGGGFQQYAAPSSNAENALRDRTEFGQLWAQSSQDPMSYLDGAVDAGLGGSFAPPQTRDPYGQAGGLPNGFAPAPPFEGRDPYRQQPEPFNDLNGSGFGAEPVSSDPLQSLDRSLPPQSYSPDSSGLAGLVPNPPMPVPVSAQTARPVPQPAALPPAAVPGATSSVIPEDFLAQFGKPKRSQNDAFLPPAAQPAPAARSLPFAGAVLSPAPPVSAAPAADGRIPDNFDPLSLPLRRKPAPVAAAPLPASPPPAEPVRAPVMPPSSPLPPVQPLPPQVEPNVAFAAMNAPADRPAADRARQLSPSLMADMVEFGGPKESPADGAFEALRARREQRKAAMLKKAQGSAPVAAPPMPALQPMPPSPAPGPVTMNPMMPPPMPGAASAAVAPAFTAPSDSAVVRAFLDGMGFQDNHPLPADPERLMNEAGAMVRAMAGGLISLLSARRMLKSEFRMDETQVQPEENNPFKFFKVAELALDELFLTRSGGFQVPAEAARSAFEDLEQHTMLTMSATQRAIKLLFERLSPDALTREGGDEGGLRIRGLGGSRKGKLETFIESHERMSRNIDTVARQIIAEAFAQVQEEQARKRAKEHRGNKP